MSKFTDLGFLTSPVTAVSATPEKDGYVAIRKGMPYNIHPTLSPKEIVEAFNEEKSNLQIQPFVPPTLPVPQYVHLRMTEYPSIEEQLDMLYHVGYEGWKTHIESIKNKYPKG